MYQYISEHITELHVRGLQDMACDFLFAINNFISCAVSCMKNLGSTVIVACIQYIV